ncbi:hypothetical protein Tco_1354186 [Tanacetum coccineum]
MRVLCMVLGFLVDLAGTVPEIDLLTVGVEVNTRVKELLSCHEHDTQDLYAFLVDAPRIVGLVFPASRYGLATGRSIYGGYDTLQETVWMVEEEGLFASERLGLTRLIEPGYSAGYYHSRHSTRYMRLAFHDIHAGCKRMRKRMSECRARVVRTAESREESLRAGPELGVQITRMLLGADSVTLVFYVILSCSGTSACDVMRDGSHSSTGITEGMGLKGGWFDRWMVDGGQFFNISGCAIGIKLKFAPAHSSAA